MRLSRHECAKRLKRSVRNEMLDQLVDMARMCAAKPPEPEPADPKLVSEVEWVAQTLVEPPCG